MFHLDRRPASSAEGPPMTAPVRILGLNCFAHDTSAALLIDGVIEQLHEEERYYRVKHTFEFPRRALNAVMSLSGLGPADLECVAFPFQCGDEIQRLLDDPHGPMADLTGWRRNQENRRLAQLRTRLDLFPDEDRKPPVRMAGHHESHMASSFYSSPFEEAAILSFDGGGDLLTSMTGFGHGRDIDILDRGFFPHGVASLYSTVTRWLGFKPLVDEGKVMGLAPYGGPAMISTVRKLFSINDHGQTILDLKYSRLCDSHILMLAPALIDLLGGPMRRYGDPLTDHHRDVAYAAQVCFEEALFEQLRVLYRQTKSPNLCLSGGAALNSVANGKISKNTPFQRVFVPPFVHDAGTAAGAAQWVHHREMGRSRVTQKTLISLGSSVPPDRVRASLANYKIGHTILSSPSRIAARLLAKGLFIGWFQGRAEAGPRALGYRSILADPRNPNAKDRLNAQVKYREAFRPYAPAVLEERFHEYFDVAPGESEPYMLQVREVRPDKRALIPSVTHVDGTGRVQTVSARDNPRFYELIKHFGEITGVPVVLNTSFNVMGEPIANTLEDALRCFYTCGLDALIVEDTLISKAPLAELGIDLD